MQNDRFARNIELFGDEGQRRLRATTVAVVGIGGLGTHVVQQLALLGVGGMALIDDEELDDSNRNRYIGAWHDDPVPGTPKTSLSRRLVHLIDPSIDVKEVPKPFKTESAFDAVAKADWVFGCVDNDGCRLIVNEVCCAHGKGLIDLATDVVSEDKVRYGGRVCVCNGDSCLYCLQEIDPAAAAQEMEDDAARKDRDAVYGVNRSVLGRSGPSVVSLNGVVASLGVTEFMVTVTGLRPPSRHLVYYGTSGKVVANQDDPLDNCYYCSNRGRTADFNLERYLRGQS